MKLRPIFPNIQERSEILDQQIYLEIMVDLLFTRRTYPARFENLNGNLADIVLNLVTANILDKKPSI